MAELPSSSSEAHLPAKLADTLQKARAVLEGEKLVQQRQKFVKLADRSDYGWKLVKKYETNELADNEEDEKRISIAEMAAEKEAAASKKKSKFDHQGPARRLTAHSRPYPMQELRPYGGWAQRQRFPSSNMKFPMPPTSRPLGPCHGCGEYGHFRRSWPRLNQTYPCTVDDGSGEDVLCMSSVSEKECMGSKYDDMCDTDMECPRFWEVEHSGASVCGNVKGSLRTRADYWEHVLGASAPVLDVICLGYILPLLSKPEKYFSPNHRSVF